MSTLGKPMVSCALVVALCGMAQAATLITDPGLGAPRDNHQGTVGMAFRTGPGELTVTALGIWDQGMDGLVHAHDVGIFSDAAGGALVTSTTIPAGTASSLAGEFRFEPIAPVQLAANSYYTVGAYYDGAGSDRFRDQNAAVTFDISGLDPAPNTRAARWSGGATLTFPNNQAMQNSSYVGPNLQYTAPPPPPPPPPPSIVNLAPAGTAVGSSEDWGSVYADAIDGNRDGAFGNGSVWHTTDPDWSPFYQVDLGGRYAIDRIQILPRTDMAQGSVTNLRLTVFEDDGAGNPGAVVWSGDYLTDMRINRPWGTTGPHGAMGQHVKLERLPNPPPGTPNFLTFAEFEVFGRADPLTPNLALGAPVTASPPGWGSAPGDGNDDDISGEFYEPDRPVYHSLAQAVGQFWEVDLGGMYPLDCLQLFNRVDAPTTSEFLLEVLEDDASTVAFSAILDAPLYDLTLDMRGVSGQYVRLETTRNEFLAFAELRVFAVPEPATLLMLALAASGLGGYIQKRRRT